MAARLLVCSGLLLMLSAAPALAQDAILFREEFDGPLNPIQWRTSELTSGVRWCDPNAGLASGPGIWFDPGTTPCNSQQSATPFGSALLADGMLQLSAPVGSRTFAYLATGGTNAPPVFPSSGDFVFSTALQITNAQIWGAGLTLMDWEDTSPAGDNAPAVRPNCVLQIWAGTTIEIYSALSGAFERLPIPIPNTLDMHQYELRCAGGTYSLYVDGVLRYGPIASTLRPHSVWIGNPVFSYWGPGGWSAFSTDYLRVSVPAATSTRRTSWGALKSRYSGSE